MLKNQFLLFRCSHKRSDYREAAEQLSSIFRKIKNSDFEEAAQSIICEEVRYIHYICNVFGTDNSDITVTYLSPCINICRALPEKSKAIDDRRYLAMLCCATGYHLWEIDLGCTGDYMKQPMKQYQIVANDTNLECDMQKMDEPKKFYEISVRQKKQVK